MKSLNRLYQKEKALYERDTTYDGYEWIEVDNAKESIISFERIDASGDGVIALFNFTPVPRNHHPIGVKTLGEYEVIFNTAWESFGGPVLDGPISYQAEKTPEHGRKYAIRVVVPPFGGLFIKLKEGNTHEQR